jgi:hypothetical protein
MRSRRVSRLRICSASLAVHSRPNTALSGTERFSQCANVGLCGDDAHPYNVFDFTLNRGRDGPKYFLKDYRQVLLADAHGGYNGVVARQRNPARRMLVACETKDPRGGKDRSCNRAEAIEMMGAPYAVEKQAGDLSIAERLDLRRNISEREMKRVVLNRKELLVRWQSTRRSHGCNPGYPDKDLPP